MPPRCCSNKWINKWNGYAILRQNRRHFFDLSCVFWSLKLKFDWKKLKLRNVYLLTKETVNFSERRLLLWKCKRCIWKISTKNISGCHRFFKYFFALILREVLLTRTETSNGQNMDKIWGTMKKDVGWCVNIKRTAEKRCTQE